MFRSAHCSSHRTRWVDLVSLSLFALILAALAVRSAHAQVVAHYTFEKGGPDGWVSFDNASTPVDSTAATVTPDPDGGTHSLLTTTNSSGQGGPALQLTGLIPGATYTITGYVLLTSGQRATDANFTVQRQDPNCQGGTCYDTVGQYKVPVTDQKWAKIGGTYTVSKTATGLLLYAQLIGPTSAQSFYLDDVTITETAPPSSGGTQNNSPVTTTFENGGLDGWSSRSGSSTLKNISISGGPDGDTNALLVSNRVAHWDGPQLNVSDHLYTGSQYSISVWVKMGPTATKAGSLNLSLQVTNSGTHSYYTVVNNTAVPLGKWVQLKMSRYSMAASYAPGTAYLYVQSESGTQNVEITDFHLTYQPPLAIQQDIPSIYKTLAQYFPVGAAVDQRDLFGAHKQLLLKHFDGITSENHMKWQETEPQPGHFTYKLADEEVALAKAHHMLVRGQNLVWSTGEQTPSWVFTEPNSATPLSASNPADVALLTERIRNHIKHVVQHFGKAVYAWDVINEPIDAHEPDCLVHGPFYKVLGAKYISIALRAAREYAPPGTTLFINEYGLANPGRLKCMVRLLHTLRAHGVPVDALGHEMHIHINGPSAQAQYHSFETIHRFFPHLIQQVTELDVSVYPANDKTSNYGANGGSVPPALLDEQGWLYKDYFDVFRRLHGVIDEVTLWGMADDDTWLDNFPIHRLDAPLPFNRALQAKPAYWGIVDPTHLPGYGLKFQLTSRSGPPQSQTWTISVTNPSGGTAYNTQINRLFLIPMHGDDVRDEGAHDNGTSGDDVHRGDAHDGDARHGDMPASRMHNDRMYGWAECQAQIVKPSKYPLKLGNIAPGAEGSVSFTVTFHHCPSGARFVLRAPWSSAVYERGVLVAKDLKP